MHLECCVTFHCLFTCYLSSTLSTDYALFLLGQYSTVASPLKWTGISVSEIKVQHDYKFMASFSPLFLDFIAICKYAKNTVLQ